MPEEESTSRDLKNMSVTQIKVGKNSIPDITEQRQPWDERAWQPWEERGTEKEASMPEPREQVGERYKTRLEVSKWLDEVGS